MKRKNKEDGQSSKTKRVKSSEINSKNQTSKKAKRSAKGHNSKNEKPPAPKQPEQSQPSQNQPLEKSKRNPRKRMKSLHMSILKQMEFYYSDANLSKSKFMQNLREEGDWADLTVFLRFNKLADMLKNAFGRIELEDLWTSLSKNESQLIQVREVEGKKEIKRRVEFQPLDKAEEESRTIYVEHIPDSLNRDILQNHFSQYGSVNYISLPKYRFNQQLKGFAFVEFGDAESANKALDAYGELKAEEGDTGIMEPQDLMSIKAFQKEQAVESGVVPEKSDSENEEEGDKKSEIEETKDEEKLNEKGTEKEKARKKKKRKRKKITASMSSEPDFDLMLMSTLEVMSKSRWKKLRNTYLDLQKKNMKFNKMKMQELYHQKKMEEEEKNILEQQNEEKKKTFKEIEFFPNVVVKFTTESPIEDRMAVKKMVSSAFIEPVKYVDIACGATEFHVRCSNEEQAKKMATIKTFGQPELLSGEAEKAYWDRIRKQRAEKLEGNVNPEAKKIRKRGKERMAIKLEEISNSHKYFGDD